MVATNILKLTIRCFVSILLDALEWIFLYFYWWWYGEDARDRSLLRNRHWKPMQEEMHLMELQVVGTIPECLFGGAYLRNGPNAAHLPKHSIHLFDGDGMIHAITFPRNHPATYANHLIRTARWKLESEWGRSVLVKVADMKGKCGMLILAISKARQAFGILPRVGMEHGMGTANTAIVWHAGRVMALHEGDVPYVIRVLSDGALQTLGPLKKNDPVNPATSNAFMPLPHACTAHPKRDPKNGEMLTFGYSLMERPFLHVSLISEKGETIRTVPIDMPEPVMIHDCAMTDRYFIVLDCPLVFSPKAMVSAGSYPFEFRTRNTRIGLIERSALRNGEDIHVQWLELPPCFIFHTVNAWDDLDGRVVMFVCRFDDFDLEKLDCHRPFLYRFDLDPTDGSSKQHPCLGNCWALDFPRINENFLGSRSRYAYFVSVDMLFSGDIEASSSIVKVDLQLEKVVGEVCFGACAMAGEAVFVPKQAPVAEDDGFLITLVTKAVDRESFLAVIDAHTMSQELVAKVRIPHRVPLGFHGLFLGENEICMQQQVAEWNVKGNGTSDA